MSTNDLLDFIDSQEYILPKDILSRATEEQLIHQVEEIYHHHPDKIDNNPEFRRKYIELVNYLLVLQLQKPKSTKKTDFNQNLIRYLLASPETA